MGVSTNLTNKPINPRGNDQSPKGYNRAALYSGKALSFDGVNDYVDVTASAFDLYTLSFYFKGAIGTGTNGFVFHTNDQTNDGVAIGHVTSTLTGETIVMGNNGIYTAISESFADGVHFVTITWNATASKYDFYVNGQEVETFNSGSDAPLHSNVTNPKLGYRPSFNDFYLDGGLSNVRAFNVTLTAAQVSDLYNNPEKIVPTGVSNDALKLWLPMMEGAGTTAYDGSGNGNHGTISGATYVNGVGAPVAQSAVMDWNKNKNEAVYSEDFSQSDWIKTALTLDANQVAAPDGQITADEIHFTASSGSKIEDVLAGLYNNQTHSVSVWARVASGTEKFRLKCTHAGVTDYFSSSLTATTEWQRFTFSQTFGATSGSGIVYGMINDTDAQARDIYFWGFQLETNTSTAGPYVRTGATAQTTPVLLPKGLTSGRDITGVNLFENARKQGALNLDGNSWAEVHDNGSLDITDAITLECWINSTDKDQYHHIISKNKSGNANYAILTEVTTGYLAFEAVSGELKKTDYNIMDGNWNHIVVTYDETNLKFYINGSLDDTIAYTSAIPTNDVDIHIGARPDGVQLYEADIAQPRIYNRALTAEEVERNYNAGKNIYK